MIKNPYFRDIALSLDSFHGLPIEQKFCILRDRSFGDEYDWLEEIPRLLKTAYQLYNQNQQ